MSPPALPRCIAIAALASLAGCLEEVALHEEVEAMCEVQQDCNVAAGEVCDQGVCWGNPPASAELAAVLIPPDNRPDLATTEIPLLDIAADGMIHGLEFEEAATLGGRVLLACSDLDLGVDCGDETSIPARIHVTRPSSIPGGRAFSRTVTARGGVGPGEKAFTLRLPPVGPGEPPYEATIRPTDPEIGIQGGDSLEAAAPPLRLTLEPSGDDEDVEWVMGDAASHVHVMGRIVDAAGRGIADRRVYAVGRFSEGSAEERVSTTATSNGRGEFRLIVPADVDGPVSVVVRPPSGEVAPRLRADGIEVPALAPSAPLEPLDLDELVMPSYPSPTPFAIPVEGADSGGGKVPVEGAKVTFETVLDSEPGITAMFSASATTDEEGRAELALIPAGEHNRPYQVRVTTPSSSQHASSSTMEIAVGPGTREATSYLASISLPRRVLVDGEIADSDGIAIEGAQIEAHVSPSLSWKLDGDRRARVADHRSPTATSDEGGRFLLWLDPEIVDRTAIYDLALIPPARVRAPRWSVDGLVLGADSATVALGVVELPRPSHARGVVSAGGEEVPGAEVWLYEIGGDEALCDAAHAPGGADCEPPARLRGLWRAGDDGWVWLVLPNPD